MRRIIAVAITAGSLLVGAPAYADHDYDDRDRYGHGSDYGGNERNEDYEGANCKYVCPQFDRSPVQDAFNFNPQICLPGATCHFEDRRDERRTDPETQEGME